MPDNGYEVDFTDYDDNPIIDKGTFDSNLYDIKNDPTSTGAPMIEFIFKLKGGPFDGWQRTLYCPLQKKDGEPMLFRLAAVLKVFGLSIPKGKLTIPRTQLLGRPCRLVIDHEPDTYNDPSGKTLRDVIKQVLPAIGGGSVTPTGSPKAPSATPAPKAPAAKKAAAAKAPGPGTGVNMTEPPAESEDEDIAIPPEEPATEAPAAVEEAVAGATEPAADGADNEFDFS